MEEQEEVKAEAQKELEIDYKFDGFLEDASYSFHIHGLLEEYKDKFPGAEKLIVSLYEIHYFQLGRPSAIKTIDISEDRKEIKINYSDHKSYDKKGKETGQPTSQSVFASLRFILNKAVKEYNVPKVVE